MGRDARELMEKQLSSTTLPNTILNRQQADAWIDLTIDQSVLLKNIRVERINFPSGVFSADSSSYKKPQTVHM